MYQNMRHLLAGEGASAEDTRSVHFLSLPKAREDLIHTEIESAVSHMQTVIELGRVIRDRKTLPVKVSGKTGFVILSWLFDPLLEFIYNPTVFC